MDDIFLTLLKNKIESGEISIEEIPSDLVERLDV
jgi:hypothetical protein